MKTQDAIDFILAQEREIIRLRNKVSNLEDGLNRMVTCGNTIVSALAWDVLNEAANSSASLKSTKCDDPVQQSKTSA